MTFNGRWSKEFNDTRELAKVGFFFFVGHSDQVQFAFCAGMVGNWEEGDVPIYEHMKYFKTCLFVQGVDKGNIPAKPSALIRGYDICERSL